MSETAKIITLNNFTSCHAAVQPRLRLFFPGRSEHTQLFHCRYQVHVNIFRVVSGGKKAPPWSLDNFRLSKLGKQRTQSNRGEESFLYDPFRGWYQKLLMPPHTCVTVTYRVWERSWGPIRRPDIPPSFQPRRPASWCLIIWSGCSVVSADGRLNHNLLITAQTDQLLLSTDRGSGNDSQVFSLTFPSSHRGTTEVKIWFHCQSDPLTSCLSPSAPNSLVPTEHVQ